MWAGLGHPEPEVTSGGPAPPEGACRLPFKTLELLAIGGFHIKTLISNFSRGQSETRTLSSLCKSHNGSPSIAHLPGSPGGPRTLRRPPTPASSLTTSVPRLERTEQKFLAQRGVWDVPRKENKGQSWGPWGGPLPLPTLGCRRPRGV